MAMTTARKLIALLGVSARSLHPDRATAHTSAGACGGARVLSWRRPDSRWATRSDHGRDDRRRTTAPMLRLGFVVERIM